MWKPKDITKEIIDSMPKRRINYNQNDLNDVNAQKVGILNYIRDSKLPIIKRNKKKIAISE